MNKVTRCLVLALATAMNFTITAAEQSSRPTNPSPAVDVKMAPIPLKLPPPSLSKNGPVTLLEGPHVDALPDRPRPPFYAPVGATNVALGEKVTSSVRRVYQAQLTDGKKDDLEEQVVRVGTGLQWVQIDLGREHHIYAVVLWHNHIGLKYFRDVVVQVSNDSRFQDDVRTLFNNDWDNSSGLGTGNDKEYCETHEGKLIDAKGIKARYVRLYSNGYWDARAHGDGTFIPENEYQEVEIYGLPVKVYDAAGKELELAPLPLKLPLPMLK